MPIKRLSDLITSLADGELDARASARLTELCDAVETNGGTGKLVLTLVVAKQNRMAVIKPTLKVTKPEPAVDPTMYYVTKDGELTEEDPRQTSHPAIPMKPARIVPMRDEPDPNDPKKGA